MKRKVHHFFYLSLLCLFSIPSFAQTNLIDNGDFSYLDTSGPCGDLNAFALHPFGGGCVGPNWGSAQGSPQLHGLFPIPPASPPHSAFTMSRIQNGECKREGFYYNVSLQAGVEYHLTFSIRRGPGETNPIPSLNFMVNAANGITNNTDGSDQTTFFCDFLPADVFTNIIAHPVNVGDDWQTVTTCFTLSKNYSQLWFTPSNDLGSENTQNTFLIDDIILEEQATSNSYEINYELTSSPSECLITLTTGSNECNTWEIYAYFGGPGDSEPPIILENTSTYSILSTFLDPILYVDVCITFCGCQDDIVTCLHLEKDELLLCLVDNDEDGDSGDPTRGESRSSDIFDPLSKSDANQNWFNIYPNPVREQLTIETNKTLKSITIFNANLQQVKTLNKSDIENGILNIDILENGIYFLQAINMDNEVEIKKVVKID